MEPYCTLGNGLGPQGPVVAEKHILPSERSKSSKEARECAVSAMLCSMTTHKRKLDFW